MRRPVFGFLILALGIFAGGCSRQTPAMEFDKLTQDFIYGSLALVSGQRHGDRIPRARRRSAGRAGGRLQRRGLGPAANLLQGFPAAGRRPGSRPSSTKSSSADLDIMKNNVDLALLELDTIQSYKHNPTVYVELVGNALYTPYMLNYAPIEKRFGHIIKRLEKIPALFDQAKANLVDAPEVWNRVAREENDGNIELIDKTLRDAAPESQKAAYAAAADKALCRGAGFQRVPQGQTVRQDLRLAPGQRKVREEIRAGSGLRPHPRKTCWPRPRRI